MANIGVRSPYFKNYTDSTETALSSKIEVSIVALEDPPLTQVLRYTIIKNTGDTVRLDISELVRDYINPTYSGSFTLGAPSPVSVSLSISFYDALGATGTQVGDTQNPAADVAYDAYAYFSEGNNFNISNGVLLSGSTIWAPLNTSGSFYIMAAGALQIVVYGASVGSADGITIKRHQCSKYPPIKCVFVNKFGVLQELYFFNRSDESFSAMGNTFKTGAINSDGTYNVYSHQVVDFNKNGRIEYSLNTGFVDESYNPYIQELMLSEQVWLNITGTGVVPVKTTTSSVQYRTSLNDKMVNYTVGFEQSNDIISTVR